MTSLIEIYRRFPSREAAVAHLERVRAKRAALQGLEAQLATLSAQCASGHRVADCGILEELIHAAGRGLRLPPAAKLKA